jgi:hypothetical protein
VQFVKFQGISDAQGAFCKMLLVFFAGTPGAGAWRHPGPPRRHLLLPAALSRREDPLELSLHATPLPLLLSSSLARSSSFSPCSLTVARARRLAPPFRTPPCSSEVLRRSASPSSISPPKELSRRARSRRHRRGFLAGPELVAAHNSSPPPLLRASRPHRNNQGEPPVRQDPFSLLLPRHSARHGRPPAVPGSRSAWAVAQPTWPG